MKTIHLLLKLIALLILLDAGLYGIFELRLLDTLFVEFPLVLKLIKIMALFSCADLILTYQSAYPFHE